ncbi:hypothetical protein DSC45_15040 [Streptomyces sp. YIM 130001]|uniref:DUF305 domain-containing protein n=1 Tax=Streptomyces sp. YIM 130001 TaxID=2259644 RepID=UPI000E65E03D|nr:DUF305 domain-containing protein [Streptomyces sp. YIM 130001]RII17076.1 hypothetical protein DSC45_15040 [Streptomyces sp. YIM 130001]
MRRSGWAAVCATVALAAAGGVTAALAGSPDARQDAAGPAGAATASPGPADAGFARDMAIHHQQAVEMSFVVRDRTDDEEVRRLAYDIANTQANQRGMLLGWLDLWDLPKVTADKPMKWMGMEQSPGMDADGALMPGMATKSELGRLAKADGRQAEVLYLQLMTEHHKGGVHMAEGCADQCTVGAERSLAKGMVSAQESELDLMADLLEKRGAAPRKAG